MDTMACQITSLTIVYSIVYPGAEKKSKLRVTGLCVGNSPVTGEFPAQMASNAKNVSIGWRHHEMALLHRIQGLQCGKVAVGVMDFSDVADTLCEEGIWAFASIYFVINIIDKYMLLVTPGSYHKIFDDKVVTTNAREGFQRSRRSL